MSAKLNRHIGLAALIVYGIGDILGSGIYALIGRAAGEMGNAVWLAFATSMFAAGLTGLSYASLGSRHPKAGGAAYFTSRAFKRPFVAYVVGLATLGSGLASMAVGSRAFAGYFNGVFGNIPLPFVVVGFALLIAGIVIRGIKESITANILCTAIETTGLLIVLVVGFSYIGKVDYFDAVTEDNPSGEIGLSIVLSGAVLTFYSFLGFEDLINVAEEVKNPERNLPLGLISAVLIASVIYMLISIVAVSVVPAKELAKSSAPLLDVVVRAAPGFPKEVFSFVAMFAVANTTLLNFITGSRLLYGMANEGLVPKPLARVGKAWRTPYVASVVILILLLILALLGDISSLARATSVLILGVFVLVNLSLIRLKYEKKEAPGKFEVPYFVPVLGIVVCLTLLTFSKGPELLLAGGILTGIGVLYLFKTQWG